MLPLTRCRMLTVGCSKSSEALACRKFSTTRAGIRRPNKNSHQRPALKLSLRPNRKLCYAALPQYELSEGIDSLSNVFRLAEGVAIITALSYTALPLLKGGRLVEPASPVTDDLDRDEVRWGVMTVLSCLPLFNWLAWIFAALEEEERAGLYYSLALLYGLPQFSAGFKQEWFSIATLIAGVAHIQLVRLAEERGVQQGNLGLGVGLREAPGRASRVLGDTARAFSDAIQSNDEKDREGGASKLLQEREEDYTAEELKKWDAKFREREKEKDA